MFKGDSLQFSVVVRDCDHTVLPDYSVGWFSNSPDIVTVDDTGLAIARAQGRGWIVWSADSGRASGSIRIQVNEYAARVEIGPTDLRVVPEGPGFLTATAFTENGDVLLPGWTATWESGDEGIAVVDTSGVVHGVAEGVTSITATVHDVSATVDITVTLLTFVDVRAGGSFTCGNTTDALVFCWGRNFQGELGDPARPSGHHPRMVAGLTRVRSVATGGSHACSLDEDGTAMCWGSAASAQLGADFWEGSHRPSRVLSDIPFRDMSAASTHTCGITTGDMAFCWGSNVYGQLGAESASVCSFGKWSILPCSRIPTAVSGFDEPQVISAGGRTHLRPRSSGFRDLLGGERRRATRARHRVGPGRVSHQRGYSIAVRKDQQRRVPQLRGHSRRRDLLLGQQPEWPTGRRVAGKSHTPRGRGVHRTVHHGQRRSRPHLRTNRNRYRVLLGKELERAVG